MTIPQGTPDSQSAARLNEAADEARRRGCTYFVQSENNGTVSYHRKRERATDAARAYGKRTPGLCRAAAYRVDDDGEISQVRQPRRR